MAGCKIWGGRVTFHTARMPHMLCQWTNNHLTIDTSSVGRLTDFGTSKLPAETNPIKTPLKFHGAENNALQPLILSGGLLHD